LNQRRPVLVLAGTSRVVVTIARCLDRHGIVVDVAQLRGPGQVNIASRAIRNTHYLQDFAVDGQFEETLMELLNRYDYDTIIPTTDESLIAIAPMDDALRQRVYPGCPRPEVVRTVLDKRLTLQAAEECGISVPIDHRIRSLAELAKRRNNLRFPIVAKPASKEVEVNYALRHFQNYDQVRDAFLTDPGLGRHLFQEYCEGYGVGIEILVWNDEIHAVFQHRRLKELPHTGGVSVLAEAQTPDPDLVESSVKLLRRLHWQGVAMVEYRYDPVTRRAVLMEVNGRYWGSLPVSVHAGVEFPYYEWQLAHGWAKAGPVPAYAPGRRALWRTGDAMRSLSIVSQWCKGRETLRTVAKEAVSLVADGCSATPDALWQWRDASPALQEFKTRILAPILSPRNMMRLVPSGFSRQARTYLYFGVRHGLRHTSLKVLYALGLRGRNLKSSIRTSMSFLFVCSGNIMRSPMAAALLRQCLQNDGVRITSAGLFASAGKPADPTARMASREFGITLDHHLSAPITAETVDQAEVIFVMDHLNEAVLINRFPQASHKTFLLGACLDQSGRGKPVEILDPYNQGLVEVRRRYLEIQSCVQTLTGWLPANLPEIGVQNAASHN
jgi:protein-tyrosine-phosphatase/predicted ATP-grasp superfamily ATP-dependent carboligase